MANMSSNTNTANTTHSQCSATTDTNHQCQNDTHTSKATGMPTHKQEEAQRQITHEHWMATSIVFLQMLFIDLRSAYYSMLRDLVLKVPEDAEDRAAALASLPLGLEYD